MDMDVDVGMGMAQQRVCDGGLVARQGVERERGGIMSQDS